MLKTIVIVILVLLAAILIFAATKPDSFRVERSTVIKAPPEKIFPLINDLHGFNTWSPYYKKDPAMQKTYSGAASGQGAAFDWDGNKHVGKGHMEITDSAPPSKVTFKLDFIKPFEGHNVAEIVLTPNAEGTNVTWAFHGPSPYIQKLMSIFFSMDKMVGADFEAGLANLKAIAEK